MRRYRYIQKGGGLVNYNIQHLGFLVEVWGDTTQTALKTNFLPNWVVLEAISTHPGTITLKSEQFSAFNAYTFNYTGGCRRSCL